MVYFAGKSLWRVSGSRWLSHHWRMTRWMELPPRKVLISEEVAFSLTSVQRFVHQPLSSFSFHTIEFNKPEIILCIEYSFFSFLFCFFFVQNTKLYIPSTPNIDLILWHTQLIMCAENVKSWFKSWVISFTFQAYFLPHTLHCICVEF